MFIVVQFISVSSLFLYSCYGFESLDIKFYEYGEHVEGEEISFAYNGVVPGFEPNYDLNVTLKNEELKPQLTYLRVEYYNVLSPVNITYDPEWSVLHFHIKYPFVDTPIGVMGYSLPLVIAADSVEADVVTSAY